MFGLQALPVRSEVAAPELMKALPFSLVSWLMASATDEVGTSKIASTLSWSYQVRAMVEPTSGLFWWSAETISTFMPLAAAPKSSTAIFAAASPPGPDTSAYRPDMSFITPILMTPSEICACAAAAPRPQAAATKVDRRVRFIFISNPFQLQKSAGAAAGPIQTPSTSCSMGCLASSSDAPKRSITWPCSMT